MSDKPLVIPDYLKAIIAEQETPDSSQLVSTTGSVPRISLKGQKFRFIEEGEEVAVDPGPILMIILGAQPEHGMAKTYYKDGYTPGSTAPPDCSSSDGVQPDSWVSNPVSPKCTGCPMNAWGSAMSMDKKKKAKACRDSKRLMVVRPNEVKEGTIYILNVTVSSLKNLSEFGKELATNKLPMAAVVTRLTMAGDSDFPVVEFSIAGILNEKVGPVSLERSAKREWVFGTPSGPALEHQAEAAQALSAPAEAAVVKEAAAQKPDQTVSDVDNLLDQWTS